MCELCALTPAERALLRSTRPVRDPVEVLAAKVRGGEEQKEVETEEEVGIVEEGTRAT